MNKVPPVFLRRFNSHKFEKIMKRGAIHAYWDTTNRKDFKRELASSAADALLYTGHSIDPETELTKEEMDSIVDFVISIFGSVMDLYFNNLKKEYPMG